jgi:catechol 2,3-dioxygenase-like lactoylglutathione lyase family enzyme
MIVRRRRLTIVVLLFTSMLLPAVAFSQLADKPPVITRLRYATIVVPDYDQALHWYTDVLGLEKVEEGTFGEGKRWLVVAPRGNTDVGIILEIAKPVGSDDPIHDYKDRVGKETRWVFEVEDCQKFYDWASKRGVKFLDTPAHQSWGTKATFADLYGNVFVVSSR